MTETFYAKVMVDNTIVLFRINLHNTEAFPAAKLEDNTPFIDRSIDPEHME